MSVDDNQKGPIGPQACPHDPGILKSTDNNIHVPPSKHLLPTPAPKKTAEAIFLHNLRYEAILLGFLSPTEGDQSTCLIEVYMPAFFFARAHHVCGFIVVSQVSATPSLPSVPPIPSLRPYFPPPVCPPFPKPNRISLVSIM